MPPWRFAMSGELLPERKANLAFAIAQGASLRKWAEANGVPNTTAYRLAEVDQIPTRFGG
jgi:hypothetical protein